VHPPVAGSAAFVGTAWRDGRTALFAALTTHRHGKLRPLASAGSLAAHRPFLDGKTVAGYKAVQGNQMAHAAFERGQTTHAPDSRGQPSSAAAIRNDVT